jgi:hypothetical protein
MFFIEKTDRANIPFRFKIRNTCDITISGVTGILYYLPTAGRTSATMAIKSQIRPFCVRSGILADREHHGRREVSIAHLFPHEASHTDRAALVEA